MTSRWQKFRLLMWKNYLVKLKIDCLSDGKIIEYWNYLTATMAASFPNGPWNRHPCTVQCLTRPYSKFSEAWRFSQCNDMASAGIEQHHRNIVCNLNHLLVALTWMMFILISILAETRRLKNSPWKFFLCKYSVALSRSLSLTVRHILSKNINTALFTNFTNEIVYSPSNPQLDNLFEIVKMYVRPFLNVNSVASGELLEPRLIQANSYVGVEFPDWYSVSLRKKLAG